MTKESNAFIEEFVIKPSQSGVLDNMAFAVKDCIDIKDRNTGFGNPTWQNTHPKAVANAICVEHLLLSGATCLGKTITDEFTYSLIGENHFYGTPLNPKVPERVPGGSSSGSASAVACGIVDFALGTDTGGSVRVPAANCGIYGFRPTHGRISVAGVIPLAPSLDTVGVLAKDIPTLKEVTRVLLGTDLVPKLMNQEYKVMLVEEAMVASTIDVRNLILNYLTKNQIKYNSIKLSEITSNKVTIPYLCDLYRLIHSSELWTIHGPWVENTKPKLGPIADYNFNQIAKVTDRTKLLEATQERELFRNKLQEFLSSQTLLCFPTAPDFAPLKGIFSGNPDQRTSSTYSRDLIGINAIAGLAKLPQITIPINDNSNYPPIGISFVAGTHKDEILLEQKFKIG